MLLRTPRKSPRRSSRLGATRLSSKLAHWSTSDKPATIVMPTGTGKTESAKRIDELGVVADDRESVAAGLQRQQD